MAPKYTQQFHIAAETALHNCYRSCLALAKERRLRYVPKNMSHVKCVPSHGSRGKTQNRGRPQRDEIS